MSKISNRSTRFSWLFRYPLDLNLASEIRMNGTENIKDFGVLKDIYLFIYDPTINAKILQEIRGVEAAARKCSSSKTVFWISCNEECLGYFPETICQFEFFNFQMMFGRSANIIWITIFGLLSLKFDFDCSIFVHFFLAERVSWRQSAECDAFSLKTKLATKLGCYDAKKKLLIRYLNRKIREI